MNHIPDIKKLLKTEKMIVGTKRTLKGLKAGTIKKVYVAKNCDEEVKESINYYSKIGGVEIIQLDMPNDELGDICKKTFSVSIIGILND